VQDSFRYSPAREFEPAAAVAPIAIDTRKVVTGISTAGVEKPVELALGETKTVADDVNAAVSSLAQMKRS
jgi:hypothetical protein